MSELGVAPPLLLLFRAPEDQKAQLLQATRAKVNYTTVEANSELPSLWLRWRICGLAAAALGARLPRNSGPDLQSCREMGPQSGHNTIHEEIARL